jgi:hypothetical protein
MWVRFLLAGPITKRKSMTKENDSSAIAMQEFLDKGGVIQKIKPNVSGRVEGASYSAWSKKKPSTSPLANPPEDDE